MSRTIGSPAWITRSDASWCGRRGVRARADDRELGASSWPSAMRRSRTSCATSASVRPTSRPAAIAATTRSAARGGPAEHLDLVAVLDDAQLAQGRSMPAPPASPRHALLDRAGDAAPQGRRKRRALAQPSSGSVRRVLGHGVADHPRDQGVCVVALFPGDDGQIPRGGRGTRSARASPRAAGRRGKVPSRRDDQHRQPLQRHGRIAVRYRRSGPTPTRIAPSPRSATRAWAAARR